MNTNQASTSPEPRPWRYSRTAVVLHWALALLITATVALGFYMMSVEDEPGSGMYFDWHKSIGLVIALLVLARVLWRLTHAPDKLPASVALWNARLASTTQVLLYLLMIALPVTGYLGASHSKAGVKFFGMATPAWAVPDHASAEQFFEIHSVLVWVLIGLVAMHVAGALMHALWYKDTVLRRMWFSR
jgi:cytochrome b561